MVVNNNHSNNHTPIVVALTAKYQKQQQKERKQPFQAQNSDARWIEMMEEEAEGKPSISIERIRNEKLSEAWYK